MLAGISVEYYQRLEQGRERRPSDQVLEALARVLQLDDDAVEYMRNLARPIRRRLGVSSEQPAAGMQSLLDGWELVPAYIQDDQLTVVAANELARTVLPPLTSRINLLRAMFLDPNVPLFVRDWEAAAAESVAWGRFLFAESGSDPQWRLLIEELSASSEQFRELWDRQDVKRRTTGSRMFDHPQVGSLDLRYQTMMLTETRHTVVAFYAEPGSVAENRLRRLLALTATYRSAPSAAHRESNSTA